MTIDINQGKIALRDSYDIFIGEKQVYSASSEFFRIFSVINLFKSDSAKARITLNKLWSFFKPKYDIRLSDNTILEFRNVSLWKVHNQCQFGQDLFDIYGHSGRKYSIYKNDKQVAWWDKEAVTWFAGDNYKIIANDDSDFELIIAFCLIIDNYLSNNRGNTVTIYVGNIGGEAKEFNPGWQPNCN